jgi:hypothetical protein
MILDARWGINNNEVMLDGSIKNATPVGKGCGTHLNTWGFWYSLAQPLTSQKPLMQCTLAVEINAKYTESSLGTTNEQVAR